MSNFRINKPLIVYTLIVFCAGIFTTGIWLLGQNTEFAMSTSKPVEAAVTNSNPSVFFGPDTIHKIVEKTGPAVVKIETEVETTYNNNFDPFFNDPFFRHFFDMDIQPRQKPHISKGLGSGFIISDDGYIVTNNHVVDNATRINVYLASRKEPYTAKLIGSDTQLDLAVIKINAQNKLPFLEFGNTDKLNVGNWVIAIGNPYGLDHTVTVGVISAKGRPINIDGTEFKNLLQTDASINPGNSGGPLLNLQGEVIGINTAINAQAQGIGFAIPSSTVTQVLDQLIENGKVIRPWLGIYMQALDKELAEYFGLKEAKGALISAVADNSPAQKAGLQRGDIILEYNKQEVSTPQDLQELVKDTQIGEKIVLLVHRDGKTIYATIKIEARN